MPFHSRASRGCGPCRKRKIRCDLQRPSCTGCILTKRECSGYRTDSDIRFIDQTQKAKTQSIRHPSSFTDANPNPNDPGPKGVPQSSRLDDHASLSTERVSPLELTLLPSLHTQAIELFANRFIAGTEYVNVGPFEYISILYNTDREAFELSHQALALAAFSKHVQSTDVLQESAREYGRALRRVNARLQDEALAQKDSTLLSVMLLASYEAALGFGRASMAAWTAHIRGGAKLLELRGESQLDTYVGRRMSAQMMANVIVDCFVNKRRLPEMIRRFRKWQHPAFSNGPYWHSSGFILEIVEFHGIYNTEDIAVAKRIAKFAEIDENIRAYLRKMPRRWKPTSCVEFYSHDEAYGGKADVYLYQDLAFFWSTMLSCRIYLNKCIIEHVRESIDSTTKPGDKDLAIMRDAEYAIEECGSRMCALVPQLFDRLKGRDHRPRLKEGNEEYGKLTGLLAEPTGSPIMNFLTESGRLRGLEGIGAGTSKLYRNHVWPLFYLGSLTQIDLGRRKWAIEQLQYLATTKHSILAAAARQTLLEDTNMEPFQAN